MKKETQEKFIFWLAVTLSVIGVAAILMLALHALGLF